MSAPARAWRAWSRFWFREVDGAGLAAVRVAFAAPALYFWLGTAPVLRRYYSDRGEFPIAAARIWSPDVWARVAMPEVLGGLPATVVLFGLLFVALVCLLAGYRTRLVAAATWALLTWFQYRNPTFLNGGDEVMRLTAFYLTLAYLGVRSEDRVLTLDRRRILARSGGAPGRGTVPVWTLRLFQIQLCVLYLVSGFWKIVDPSWWDGSAIYYALAGDTFGRFGLPPWAWLQPFFVIASVAVAWWELLFPALMASRRTRMPALLFGVALHVGILMTMNIGPFPLAVLAMYPAFLDPDALRRVGRRLLRVLAEQLRGQELNGPVAPAEAELR